ncbi:MAG TPA: hypothetical protein VF194_14320 [Ferrovibrio sp.]|uniref:hypothetical protein n=1 Tax=Ferrovibrio sp. TaxID=1917215 RepID=UPI002ED5A25C
MLRWSMLQWLLALSMISALVVLGACSYNNPPPKVPDQTNPGAYKTCPGGRLDC